MIESKFKSKEIEEFCQFLAREYGLSFPQARYSFVRNRVEPVLDAFGLRTFSDLVLNAPRNLQLRLELLNCLTTNETWFFRHPEHFSILKKHIFPKLLAQKQKIGDNRIRIWSAGCSIGAELYSILFTLLDLIKSPQSFNIQLIGSDIASDAVSSAREGRYSVHELRLLNEGTLKKYFTPSEKGYWRVISEFKNYTSFEQLNLLDSWPARQFDIIFCRNTMIYFDTGNKEKITRRFFDSLVQNGYYFTSTNESVHSDSRTVFRKLFLENEIVYQKSSKNLFQTLVKFVTPSDLLRAMNLLKNNGFEHQIEKIEAKNELTPSRALSFDSRETRKIMELFSLSSIKVLSTQTIEEYCNDSVTGG